MRGGIRKPHKADRGEYRMTHSEVKDSHLVLVPARKSRGTDHADYDVKLGDASGPVVGRIMRHPQASEAQPWFWTITAREHRHQSIIAAMQRAANRRCGISKRDTPRTDDQSLTLSDS